MRLFLKLLIACSVALWAVTGWVWRDEIGARVAEWRGTKGAAELIDGAARETTDTIDRAASAVARQGDSVPREVYLPGPLRTRFEHNTGLLTVEGLVVETNKHRSAQGLLPLTLDNALSRAARTKAEDMFARQYFAHEAPDGAGAAALIESNGYAYVTIGENLALGNYEDDVTLVQAWMDSPGHRENILNARFTEIGVGVVQGTYEEETTWMAVQEFGKPLSDCPTVETTLKTQIESKEATLDSLGSRIEALKQELDRTRPLEGASKGEVDAYNANIEMHNELVAQHNTLRATLQDLISRYNSQVTAYNVCLEAP